MASGISLFLPPITVSKNSKTPCVEEHSWNSKFLSTSINGEVRGWAHLVVMGCKGSEHMQEETCLIMPACGQFVLSWDALPGTCSAGSHEV